MIAMTDSATEVLQRMEEGDPRAHDQLLPLVYADLRKYAARLLADEKPGQTLQPTALVHEAYLRLVDVERAQQWNGRAHFFMAAAEAMRRILVERARKKQCIKRGGDRKRCALLESDARYEPRIEDVLDLDATLDGLAAVDQRAAQLVKLRFFCAMTMEEASETLGVSTRTAKRLWTFGRAWLRREMTRQEA